MRNQWQVFLGAAIILGGVLLLIGAVFDVDTAALCVPVGLIAAGIWLLVRPHLGGMAPQIKLLGDVRRYGAWQVSDEEIWIGLGDVRLDLSEADVPVGETTIRISGFLGDVRVHVPEGIGISVSSLGFITDARVLGQKEERVAAPVHLSSEGYEAAERRVRLELGYFLVDVRVRPA